MHLISKAILVMSALTATPALAEVHLEVDRSEKTVTIKQDGAIVSVKPLALGKPTSPTPLGSHKIYEVHMNPDWNGTRGQGYVPPGPRNPLGRVRLRYDMPYAMHGTNNPDSIGKYASLGCIRMHNEDVIELAELILKDTGDWKGQAWFQNMLDQPTRQFQIKLSSPVRISIVQ